MSLGQGTAAIAFSTGAAPPEKAGLQQAGFAQQLAKPGKSLTLFGRLAVFGVLQDIVHILSLYIMTVWGVKRPEMTGAKNIFKKNRTTEGIWCEKSITLQG